MKCVDCRELLSARLDDEDVPRNVERSVDAHLRYCPECEQWYDQAALITRLARITPAVAGPDVTAAVMARVPKRRNTRLVALRWTLAIVGVLQVALALRMTLVDEPGTGYEVAAWNLALAGVFGMIALRGIRAAGIVPLLGGFVAIIVVGYLSGRLTAEVDPYRILSHMLAMVGLVVIVLLQRMRPSGPNPASSVAMRRVRQVEVEPVGPVWRLVATNTLRRDTPA